VSPADASRAGWAAITSFVFAVTVRVAFSLFDAGRCLARVRKVHRRASGDAQLALAAEAAPLAASARIC
jgi:hypothetical protein